jgi:hypothetical protein
MGMDGWSAKISMNETSPILHLQFVPMLFLLPKGFPQFLIADFCVILGMIDGEGTAVLFPLGDGFFGPGVLAEGFGRTLGRDFLFCETGVGGQLRAGLLDEGSEGVQFLLQHHLVPAALVLELVESEGDLVEPIGEQPSLPPLEV